MGARRKEATYNEQEEVLEFDKSEEQEEEEIIEIIEDNKPLLLSPRSEPITILDKITHYITTNYSRNTAEELKKAILFQISALIGTILFYILYEFCFTYIFSTLIENQSLRSSACWFISYSISIWWQYMLHVKIVFGKRDDYWSTLGRTYLIYGISMIISTILNYLLTLFIDHRLAWISTLVFTGIVNYFLVSRLAFVDNKNTTLPTTTTAPIIVH
ncbi:hypothetical protein ABK040_007913 [Willaertia magna]